MEIPWPLDPIGNRARSLENKTNFKVVITIIYVVAVDDDCFDVIDVVENVVCSDHAVVIVDVGDHVVYGDYVYCC